MYISGMEKFFESQKKNEEELKRRKEKDDLQNRPESKSKDI
jgi:hypothetical protein